MHRGIPLCNLPMNKFLFCGVQRRKGKERKDYEETYFQYYDVPLHGADALPGHGLCGCGAKLKYTVQYDGGAEFGLMVNFKTHGKDITLAGKTFYREGFVQTG